LTLPFAKTWVREHYWPFGVWHRYRIPPL